ncbi:oxidative stress-responsive serine-rich protein 1 [Engraulis encrasicolus]|uniref:oxidative stress-responsive serine-rich protein 1 n=1 Tax=Engraulis encrasicolus TaxID=184585 RepID=UPI002FD19E12
MATMESGVKECEEEILQSAFKKLRVDAESAAAAVVPVCESVSSRMSPRTSSEVGGAKSKMTCLKENWHGGIRKSTRGVARSQRRRRSKSPILHPPKFTYCSSKMASPPGGHLKHKTLAEPADTTCALPLGIVPTKKELLSPAHVSPVFGAAGYDLHHIASTPREALGSPQLGHRNLSDDESGSEGAAACPLVVPEAAQGDGAATATTTTAVVTAAAAAAESGAVGAGGGGSVGGSGAGSVAGAGAASDFRSLSRLHQEKGGGACPCGQAECQCPSWQGVEVYAFTGLRNVISECERNLPPPGTGTAIGTVTEGAVGDQNTTAGTSAATAAAPGNRRTQNTGGSPRSCSEQARAYVDDITIEDLSGYMEYYLYIPKKMSHMAEMMYT